MVEAPAPTRHRYTLGACRRCGAFELHRTQARTLLHKLAKRLTPLVPMRCPACGTRSLRFASAAAARPSPPPERAQTAPIHSRRERRRRRRMRRRLTAVAWVVGSAAVAAALGYVASIG
ncbi:MAG: hypothetical protein JST54_08160 [Deltaproteobacteria bacterium]|nr:hypothetical protein [Deltaproteobacteria bacterium]